MYLFLDEPFCLAADFCPTSKFCNSFQILHMHNLQLPYAPHSKLEYVFSVFVVIQYITPPKKWINEYHITFHKLMLKKEEKRLEELHLELHDQR